VNWEPTIRLRRKIRKEQNQKIESELRVGPLLPTHFRRDPHTTPSKQELAARFAEIEEVEQRKVGRGSRGKSAFS
jgi:hypothetical protein